jgi:hypothetical protein
MVNIRWHLIREEVIAMIVTNAHRKQARAIVRRGLRAHDNCKHLEEEIAEALALAELKPPPSGVEVQEPPLNELEDEDALQEFQYAIGSTSTD